MSQCPAPATLGEIFGSGRFVLSIEIFPPKSPDGDAALHDALGRLVRYRPAFVSCTYGAGGSTQNRTLEWCKQIQNRYGCAATSHLTCVGSTREELLRWLSDANAGGVGNIMALRGDPPQGQAEFRSVAGGLNHANELVALIRSQHPALGIGVAGYPEKHVEAPSLDVDLANLKRKVDAGADAVFTQLFYENANFFKFRDRCTEVGVRVPVVPGIMPITEFARIQRITSMCGAYFPPALADRLERVKDDKTAQFEIGVEHAVAQCRELISAGAPGIHFYALNKSAACERILEALGFAASQSECA